MPDRSYLTTQGLPSRHIISAVPVIPQDDHFCGPAALATIAQFNAFGLSQEEAAELVYTPGRTGTFQHDIVSGMQRTGLLAIPVNSTEDLLTEVAADHPVIIFQNLGLSWQPVWHYSVVTGYNLPEGRILLHGGADQAAWKDFRTIGKTWKRSGFWGYIGVRVGTIPPTATEEELLQATAGLEAAQQLKIAEQSYQTVLQAYPQSFGALFGLGNIAMSRNEFKKAEEYYRKALNANPEHWYSANNLAYSLKEQGRIKDSCKLLEEHLLQVESGGKVKHELRDSYTEICS